MLCAFTYVHGSNTQHTYMHTYTYGTFPIIIIRDFWFLIYQYAYEAFRWCNNLTSGWWLVICQLWKTELMSVEQPESFMKSRLSPQYINRHNSTPIWKISRITVSLHSNLPKSKMSSSLMIASLFLLTIVSLCSGVTTAEIQAEGLACFQIAAGLPQLQSLTGSHIKR